MNRRRMGSQCTRLGANVIGLLELPQTRGAAESLIPTGAFFMRTEYGRLNELSAAT